MNTKTTRYKYISGIAIIAIVLHNLSLLQKIRHSRKNPITTTRTNAKSKNKSNFAFVSREKVAVNDQFFKQLRAIFTILLPNIRSKCMLLLIAHSTFLIMRTYLSVLVAKLDGIIVREMINKNVKGFIKGIGFWFLISIPATYTNSIIKYLQSKLSISFRTSLTYYCHNLYLSNNTHYKINNLLTNNNKNDQNIGAVDQYFTNEIALFCDQLSALFSSLGKPVLDLIIFNIQLAKNIGKTTTLGMFLAYLMTVGVLRKISPKFGKLAGEQAELDGQYRNANSKVVTNAEEISFYNGSQTEKRILMKTYTKMIKHLNMIYKKRIQYNQLEDFIIKYCWGAAGLIVCSLPVFYEKFMNIKNFTKKTKRNGDEGNRTKDFITNKRLMLSLGDAGGRVMYTYKDLAELAGYTNRLYHLIQALHLMHDNEFITHNNQIESFDDHDIHNRKKGYDYLEFNSVPIIIPKLNGQIVDKLVDKLTFRIETGDHLLITGSNGVGKSAIARVIKGLWPLLKGKLKEPSPENIFYIPQKPYLTSATLREQIIYPHSKEQMLEREITDDDLLDILKHVYLKYIPEREGGMDSVKEWKNVFSGGEKQRINLARLFYFKPKFAVLDECTSAVSADVEGSMYNYAKQLGITLITISHRLSLFKYHKLLLKLSDSNDRKWSLDRIETLEERKMGTEKEIAKLRQEISEEDQIKKRLKEIKEQLNLKH